MGTGSRLWGGGNQSDVDPQPIENFLSGDVNITAGYVSDVVYPHGT